VRNKLNNRVAELRKKNNMTTSELAKKLNVTTRTIQRYEKNELTPTVEKLINLKEIFNCSIDYLLCLSNNINESIITDKNLEVSEKTKNIFSKKLKDIIIEKELTKETLANKLEIDKFEIDRYLEGNSFPSLDKLMLIASKLNISIDFLLNSESNDFSKFKLINENIELKKGSKIKKIPVKELRDFLDSKSQE
jgi:transcriptional regulator with XRE-family HTH domain